MGNPVTHFEIVGPDANRLQDFYSRVFGWRVIPAGPSYAMVHPDGGSGINGGVGSAPEGGDASRVTVYIEVDDPNSTLDAVEASGGRRVMGPVEVPGGPTIALFTDPEGNLVGMTKATTIRGR